jgi:hypothetical protein
MGILNKEKRDPFYDVIPPGGEYVVPSTDVFVRTDGSTFTGLETQESFLESSQAKTPNRLVSLLSLRGLTRAFHRQVDIRFDGFGPVARDTGEDSALGTLAQIELNNLAGRPLDQNLYPGQLDDPHSP